MSIELSCISYEVMLDRSVTSVVLVKIHYKNIEYVQVFSIYLN